MREMFNRFLARRAFNALMFWADYVSIPRTNFHDENSYDDYQITVKMLDILRRYMDPKG